MDMQLIQHYLLRRLAFSHCPTNSHGSRNHGIVYMGLFLGVLLCSTSLWICSVPNWIKNCGSIISLDIWYCKQLCSSSRLYWFSLALHFHINFQIDMSVSIEKWDFDWYCIDSIDACKEMNIFCKFIFKY